MSQSPIFKILVNTQCWFHSWANNGHPSAGRPPPSAGMILSLYVAVDGSEKRSEGSFSHRDCEQVPCLLQDVRVHVELCVDTGSNCRPLTSSVCCPPVPQRGVCCPPLMCPRVVRVLHAPYLVVDEGTRLRCQPCPIPLCPCPYQLTTRYQWGDSPALLLGKFPVHKVDVCTMVPKHALDTAATTLGVRISTDPWGK